MPVNETSSMNECASSYVSLREASSKDLRNSHGVPKGGGVKPLRRPAPCSREQEYPRNTPTRVASCRVP